MSTEPIAAPSQIVARPSRDYRWRRYGLVLLLFGWGIYSLYDGFYNYPKVNDAFHKAHPQAENLPHPGLDIPLNKAFGIGLPPLSIVFLGWVLYASRGEYRFDGSTLSVPGHDNIPLDSIVKIDKTKWDRKGIAVLDYQLPDGATGTFKLDDFVYERPPTDAIFARIESAMTTAPAEPSQLPADEPAA